MRFNRDVHHERLGQIVHIREINEFRVIAYVHVRCIYGEGQRPLFLGFKRSAYLATCEPCRQTVDSELITFTGGVDNLRLEGKDILAVFVAVKDIFDVLLSPFETVFIHKHRPCDGVLHRVAV